jgi:hypothetical protein
VSNFVSKELITKAKDMKTERMLEEYLFTHPEYWEYDNERKEVERLRFLAQRGRYRT